MRKLRIGIDIDDVVTETVLGIENFHRRQFPREDITTPKSWSGLLDFPGLHGDQSRFKAMLRYFTEVGGFRHLLPVHGAVETIREWNNRGHHTYFISARNSRAIHDTYEWFDENKLPLSNIYFDREKKWHIERLNLDMMIDDGVHNLEHLDLQNTVIYHRPWNHQMRRQTKAHWRAANWAEVRDIATYVQRMK